MYYYSIYSLPCSGKQRSKTGKQVANTFHPTSRMNLTLCLKALLNAFRHKVFKKSVTYASISPSGVHFNHAYSITCSNVISNPKVGSSLVILESAMVSLLGKAQKSKLLKELVCLYLCACLCVLLCVSSCFGVWAETWHGVRELAPRHKSIFSKLPHQWSKVMQGSAGVNQGSNCSGMPYGYQI